MSDADVDAESNPYLRDPPIEFEPAESLSREVAEGQAVFLREAVRERDRRYYATVDPLISDATYDALFSRLVALEDVSDPDAINSPMNRVGDEPIDALETVEHVTSMLFIDQSTDADNLHEFDERVRREIGVVNYVCEPKSDGLSVGVVYEDDEFVRAATRGDDRRGDDVSAQVKTIPTIPLSLRGDHPDRLAVRGEIYMSKSDLSDLSVRRVGVGEDAFANPRNAAAGALYNFDPSVIADHPLTVLFYDILDVSARPDSQWAALDRLREWGLRVTDCIERAEDVAEAIDCRSRMQATRDDLGYEIDGTVIKVDSRGARKRLGEKSRSVHWAFTYKFPVRHEVMTVRDIVVQIGWMGRLMPVTALDPVDVGGVTVSRATLHNLDGGVVLGVTVDNRVRAKRAGDVIPQVAEITEDGGGCYEFPDECPVCGNAVDRDDPLALCSGELSCPAQREASISHFVVKGAMDIDGLGEECVAQPIDADLVEAVIDLYNPTADDLAELEGWSEASAESLMVAVRSTKHPSPDSLFVGSSISEVGEATARGLVRELEPIKAFPIEADAEEDGFDALEERLTTVPNVGEMATRRVRDFFENADNRAVIRALFDRGADPEPAKSDGDELDGLTFIVTGTLAASRSDVTGLVESHGGSVIGSVSDNTDYLVVGESPGRSKRDDAETNNAPTLAETKFETLLAKRGAAYPPEQNGQSVR